MELSEIQQVIFGGLFLLANKLQVLGDQYLGTTDMTTKQWFLSVIVSQFKGYLPSLSEVAEQMGTSRQNIKQLAIKLEEKGFLKIQKDKLDARVLRLGLTDKSNTFWEERQNQDEQFLKELFSDLRKEEMEMLYESLNKLSQRIGQMAKRYTVLSDEL